jgi:hypothetical protein
VAKHPIALRNSAGLRTMRLSKAGTQMHAYLWSHLGRGVIFPFWEICPDPTVILTTIFFASRIKRG